MEYWSNGVMMIPPVALSAEGAAKRVNKSGFWVMAGVLVGFAGACAVGTGVIELMAVLSQARKSVSPPGDAQSVLLITAILTAKFGAEFGRWVDRLLSRPESGLERGAAANAYGPPLRGKWWQILRRALLLFVLLPGTVQFLWLFLMPRF
jgi:hypothetical protein